MILMNMMMLMMVVIELETVIIIIMMKIQMIKMITMTAYTWMATVVLYLHVHWTVHALRRLECNPLSVHSHTSRPPQIHFPNSYSQDGKAIQ